MLKNKRVISRFELPPNLVSHHVDVGLENGNTLLG